MLLLDKFVSRTHRNTPVKHCWVPIKCECLQRIFINIFGNFFEILPSASTLSIESNAQCLVEKDQAGIDLSLLLGENLKSLFELVHSMCCYCIAKFDHHLELIVNLSLRKVFKWPDSINSDSTFFSRSQYFMAFFGRMHIFEFEAKQRKNTCGCLNIYLPNAMSGAHCTRGFLRLRV